MASPRKVPEALIALIVIIVIAKSAFADLAAKNASVSRVGSGPGHTGSGTHAALPPERFAPLERPGSENSGGVNLVKFREESTMTRAKNAENTHLEASENGETPKSHGFKMFQDYNGLMLDDL